MYLVIVSIPGCADHQQQFSETDAWHFLAQILDWIRDYWPFLGTVQSEDILQRQKCCQQQSLPISNGHHWSLNTTWNTCCRFGHSESDMQPGHTSKGFGRGGCEGAAKPSKLCCQSPGSSIFQAHQHWGECHVDKSMPSSSSISISELPADCNKASVEGARETELIEWIK